MQVDPLNETYGGIVDTAYSSNTTADEVREKQEEFAKAVDDGKVIAISHNRQQLLKLQEDLRKRGYRRAR